MQTHYKITTEPHPEECSITFLLNGNFSEDALTELDQSMSERRDAHQRIYIDLSEVTFVDRKAVQYFAEQAGQDLKLVNCPIYLCQWIAQVGDEAEN